MNNFRYEHSAKQSIGFASGATPAMRSSFTSALPENPVVAMAYVPFQTDLNVYDENKALSVGTLFPVLDKPFTGRGVK